MMMTTKFMKLTILMAALILVIPKAQANEKSRQRLQELFIWKVSDHLALSPEDDGKFRTIIQDLNKQKLEASREMKSLVKKMDKTKDKSKRSDLLVKYKEHLKLYLNVQQDELTKLSKLFDEEKMSKYLVVKSKLTENLRVLMGSGLNSKKKKLAKPKVQIEN